MLLTPLPGLSSKGVLAALLEEETTVGNLRNGSGTAVDRYNQYLVWAIEAAGRLGRLVSAADTQRLVTTPRHWALLSTDPAALSSAALSALVDLELDERHRALERARREFAGKVNRWESRHGLLVVADTNVYLHHDEYFDEMPWGTVVPALAEGVLLVVPLAVIDELDQHKRSPRQAKVSDTNSENVRTRARVSIKRLDALLPSPESVGVLQADLFPEAGPVTVGLLLDDPSHIRLHDVDSELVDRACVLQDLAGRKVYFVTFDTGMRVRARAAGLEVVHLAESRGGRSD